MKKLSSFSVLFFCFQLSLFTTVFAQTNNSTRTVSITTPQNGGHFNCSVKPPSNQCHFQVMGNSANLKPGDYVSLFIRIAGGNLWWRTGVSYQVLKGFSGVWVSDASVAPNSTGTMFEFMAVVTPNALVGPNQTNNPLNTSGILAHSVPGYYAISDN